MEKLVKSLSWSKIYQWQNNKKQFIKTYFEKEPFFETKEIIFGSVLGKMIELQEYFNEDLIVEDCLRNFDGEIVNNKRKEELLRKSFNNIKLVDGFIEELQELEFDLYSEYENKFQSFIGGVCTLGYSDNCSNDWKYLKEFKTGKTAWDNNRVDNHGQLDLYCLLTYLEKGYLPEDVELVWFPTTENENGEILPTGEIKSYFFDVDKNKGRILAWEEKIPKIFEEIQQAQIEWENQKLNENISEFSEGLFFMAYELQKEISDKTEKLNEIKKQIEDSMKAGNLKDYKVDGIGSVYYTQRKSWDYGDVLFNIENQKSESIDQIKNENKDVFERLEKVSESFNIIYKEKKEEYEKNNDPIIKESLAFRFSK